MDDLSTTTVKAGSKLKKNLCKLIISNRIKTTYLVAKIAMTLHHLVESSRDKLIKLSYNTLQDRKVRFVAISICCADIWTRLSKCIRINPRLHHHTKFPPQRRNLFTVLQELRRYLFSRSSLRLIRRQSGVLEPELAKLCAELTEVDLRIFQCLKTYNVSEYYYRYSDNVTYCFIVCPCCSCAARNLDVGYIRRTRRPRFTSVTLAF